VLLNADHGNSFEDGKLNMSQGSAI